MNKRNLIVGFGVLALAVTAFGVRGLTFARRAKSGVAAQSVRTIPEHVPYMFLFDHHYSNLRKAAELEQEGKDGGVYRSMFKRRAELSDAQAGQLDQVTLDCEQELALQDAKAQPLIDAYRKQYPSGALPDGVTLPPPPAELDAMQQERDAIILRARDRLRAALGEAEFARFDAFVKSRIGAIIQPGR